MAFKGEPHIKDIKEFISLIIFPYRIGSLEILTKNREYEELKLLADFILKHNFPNIKGR